MLEHRFKNLTIRFANEDFLVNGTAIFEIEDFDEDGKEATFVSAKLLDALGKDGYVNSKECLGYLGEATVEHLNGDSTLCRSLGHKII